MGGRDGGVVQTLGSSGLYVDVFKLLACYVNGLEWRPRGLCRKRCSQARLAMCATAMLAQGEQRRAGPQGKKGSVVGATITGCARSVWPLGGQSHCPVLDLEAEDSDDGLRTHCEFKGGLKTYAHKRKKALRAWDYQLQCALSSADATGSARHEGNTRCQ